MIVPSAALPGTHLRAATAATDTRTIAYLRRFPPEEATKIVQAEINSENAIGAAGPFLLLTTNPRPQLFDLAESDPIFYDDESPAVAVVKHRPDVGIQTRAGSHVRRHVAAVSCGTVLRGIVATLLSILEVGDPGFDR